MRNRRLAEVAVALAAVAGLVAVAPTAAPAQVPGKGGGPAGLSARLQVLADAAPARSTNAEDRAVDLPTDGPGSLLRADDGRLLVDVEVTGEGVLGSPELDATGATATAVDPTGTVATVAVDASALDDLVAVPGVLSATEVQEPVVGGSGVGTTPGGPAPTSAACSDRAISEADTQLKAALARSTNGVSGNGIKVGVLSDTYGAAGSPATDVADGELPGPGNPCGKTKPVQVLADRASGSDEGRAMLQLVHDIAPDAELLFATAFNGDVDFANQIRALKTAGATVIVDDISYFSEPMYQDGVIAKAVNDVTAAGAVYFSSAANSHATIGATPIGSYEATYRSTPCAAPLSTTASCHDFSPGAGVDSTDSITVPNGQKVQLEMGWNEPQFGIVDDFDVALINASGSVVASSINDNPTTGSTFEFIDFTNTTGSSQTYRLMVQRYSGTGSPRFKIIFNRARFTAVEYTASTGGDVVGPTTFGHNAPRGASAAGVAATPWFNDATIEPFSSRGPATYCWNPVNGTTPATAIPCETVQNDFAASDGTVTTVAGFEEFYGTSAAAPHAAAVAALVREARPCRTNAEVMAALAASGRPISGFGSDAQGTGLIDATTAISGLTSCTPTSTGQTYTSITPCRIVDTRASGAGGAFTAGQQRTFQVSGTGSGFAAQGGTSGGCGIPTGAVAVEASITAVGPTGDGYARAYPAGTSLPNATFINFTGGRSITNTGTIPIATSASTSDLNLNVFGAGSHVVIDIQGYYTTGSGLSYSSITPCRIVDTRASGAGGAFTAYQQRTFQVSGTGSGFAAQGGTSNGCGIPTGAVAVEASITAVAPTGDGYARAYPAGTTLPNATFINFTGATSITNTGAIPIATSASTSDLNLNVFGAGSHVVIDIQGYFAPATALTYTSITPCRIVDTRASGAGGAFTAGQQRTFQVSGTGSGFAAQGGTSGGCGLPADAVAVEASITAVGPAGVGYARAYPAGTSLPNATFINFTGGRSVTNTGTVPIATSASTSDLNLNVFGAGSHVVIDLQGYYHS